MMREEIRALIHDVIKDRYVGGIPDFSVAPPENPTHGDYSSNIAFIYMRDIASSFRSPSIHTGGAPSLIQGEWIKTPLDFAKKIIARQLGEKIDKKEIDFLERIEIAGPGFINFFLSKRALQDALTDVLAHPDSWGTSDIGAGKTVIVEYFQLNIAKRPHIGHIRSAIIGDALKRMFLSQGYTAVSDTHVGDWGTQFGILLLGWKKEMRERGEALKEDFQKDPFGLLERIYFEENERIKNDPERREFAKKEFAKLEQWYLSETGYDENRMIWRDMVRVSMDNLWMNAARLGLLLVEQNPSPPRDIRVHVGESFYEDKMAAIVALALEKGVARKTDDGAVIVDLMSEKLDEAVLIKSDGASTYLLRDLATIKYRKDPWHFWKNLYVVDVRQSHHFKQLFRVAELLGFEGVGESEHVSYGFMKLPEGGAVSTRAGTGISLEKVIDEAEEKARAVIKEKNPDLKGAAGIARQVGIGALKYFDLSHHRESDIVFSWERALSFEGNTGPYLQYTYARLKSILRKVLVPPVIPAEAGIQFDQMERRMALAIMRFPEAISDALAIYSPHVLAGYLYDLAQTANEFYHSHPVMQEQDEQKKNFRLALVSACSITLARGLNLLGIDAPEEM